MFGIYIIFTYSKCTNKEMEPINLSENKGPHGKIWREENEGKNSYI